MRLMSEERNERNEKGKRRNDD